jgi:hypothetical protein
MRSKSNSPKRSCNTLVMCLLSVSIAPGYPLGVGSHIVGRSRPG